MNEKEFISIIKKLAKDISIKIEQENLHPLLTIQAINSVSLWVMENIEEKEIKEIAISSLERGLLLIKGVDHELLDFTKI